MGGSLKISLALTSPCSMNCDSSEWTDVDFFQPKTVNIYLIQILLHDSTHLEIEAAVIMPFKLSDKNRQFPHSLNLGTSVT
jgi:hypothetical protein